MGAKKLTNRQEKLLAKKAENFCRLRMVLLAMLMRFVKQVDMPIQLWYT